MFLVRDIMYCKPGQARPMVQKFLKLSELSSKMGLGGMRVMTDVSAERYWTVVVESEAASLQAVADMGKTAMQDPEFQVIMKDYHSLVEGGRREIYTIEK